MTAMRNEDRMIGSFQMFLYFGKKDRTFIPVKCLHFKDKIIWIKKCTLLCSTFKAQDIKVPFLFEAQNK